MEVLSYQGEVLLDVVYVSHKVLSQSIFLTIQQNSHGHCSIVAHFT